MQTRLTIRSNKLSSAVALPLVGVVALAWSMSACGSSEAPAAGKTKASLDAITAPITDATAARDALLAQAQGGAIDDLGIPQQWVDKEKALLGGYHYPATATTISGSTTMAIKSLDKAGIVFAVTDSQGTCAYGEILASEDGRTVAETKPLDVPAGTECSGSGAMDALGLE